jgi:hypothetical protein
MIPCNNAINIKAAARMTSSSPEGLFMSPKASHRFTQSLRQSPNAFHYGNVSLHYTDCLIRTMPRPWLSFKSLGWALKASAKLLKAWLVSCKAWLNISGACIVQMRRFT